MKVSSPLTAVTPTNRYRYEVPARGTVVVITFYLGLLSAWMAYLAKGYAEMPPFGFIALSVIFAALAVVVLIRRLAFPCMLELTDDAILLPRGHPWPRIATIPYADIVRIVDHGDSLTLATGKGSFEIGANSARRLPCGAGNHLRQDRNCPAWVREAGTVALEGLPPKARLALRSDEFPRPLVHWVEPEDWTRYRLRAEISKPVLYQLRKRTVVLRALLRVLLRVHCPALCRLPAAPLALLVGALPTPHNFRFTLPRRVRLGDFHHDSSLVLWNRSG